MSLTGHSVAVIGLGAMGSALAKNLAAAGADVHVWNRTVAKAETLAAVGALACENPAQAIEASHMVVVCLSDYAAWAELVQDPMVQIALKGTCLIQLTAGTLPDVEAHAEQMTALGTALVEGNILCAPDQIGTEGASIITAGAPDAIAQADPVLRSLSPNLPYLGADYTTPVILSRAAISSVIGFLVGTINGAALCKAGGVPLSVFRDMVARRAPQMQTEPLRLISAIEAGDTEKVTASLSVWANGQSAVRDVSRNLGIDLRLHDSIHSLFESALTQGLGNHDLAALAEVFSSQKGQ